MKKNELNSNFKCALYLQMKYGESVGGTCLNENLYCIIKRIILKVVHNQGEYVYLSICEIIKQAIALLGER